MNFSFITSAAEEAPRTATSKMHKRSDMISIGFQLWNLFKSQSRVNVA